MCQVSGVVGVGMIFVTAGSGWSATAADLWAVTTGRNSKTTLGTVQLDLTPSRDGVISKETLLSQTEPSPANRLQTTPNLESSGQLDLSPKIIEGSPVLQRWLRQVPNVLADIANDPSFRTRLRLGYSQFPSADQATGWNAGVEDVFIGRTGLTLSGDYQVTFEGDRTAWGVDLRYYVRPLGAYINVALVVGYRNLDDRYSTDGVNLGVRLLLVLSRSGAADISLTQSWVAPGRDDEVGLTALSVGYALTRNLRLSTDIQKQNARQHKDSRVGIVLEWMP